MQNILKLKYEYNTILSGQVWDQLLRISQKYFELGDKSHKLLARQLRSLQANKAIHKIRSKAGDTIVDPKHINACFREYYEQLYTSRARGDVSNWLGPLNLPKLSDDAREALNSNITIQELVDAIQSVPNSRAAGPDGFGIQIYIKSILGSWLPFC